MNGLIGKLPNFNRFNFPLIKCSSLIPKYVPRDILSIIKEYLNEYPSLNEEELLEYKKRLDWQSFSYYNSNTYNYNEKIHKEIDKLQELILISNEDKSFIVKEESNRVNGELIRRNTYNYCKEELIVEEFYEYDYYEYYSFEYDDYDDYYGDAEEYLDHLSFIKYDFYIDDWDFDIYEDAEEYLDHLAFIESNY